MSILTYDEIFRLSLTAIVFWLGWLSGGAIANYAWHGYIQNLKACIKTKCDEINGTSNPNPS